MEAYILTSAAFEGDVIVNNDNGHLTADFTKSSISLGQQKFVLDMMSKGLQAMLAYFNQVGSNNKMVKVIIDFDMFWNKYDEKTISSKLKTRNKWNRMSLGEQSKAFYFIPRYFAAIPSGTRKKNAETYLNAELWNN